MFPLPLLPLPISFLRSYPLLLTLPVLFTFPTFSTFVFFASNASLSSVHSSPPLHLLTAPWSSLPLLPLPSLPSSVSPCSDISGGEYSSSGIRGACRFLLRVAEVAGVRVAAGRAFGELRTRRRSWRLPTQLCLPLVLRWGVRGLVLSQCGFGSPIALLGLPPAPPSPPSSFGPLLGFESQPASPRFSHLLALPGVGVVCLSGRLSSPASGALLSLASLSRTF